MRNQYNLTQKEQQYCDLLQEGREAQHDRDALRWGSAFALGAGIAAMLGTEEDVKISVVGLVIAVGGLVMFVGSLFIDQAKVWARRQVDLRNLEHEMAAKQQGKAQIEIYLEWARVPVIRSLRRIVKRRSRGSSERRP